MLVCRTASTEIVINMGGVVVDDEIMRPGWAGSSAGAPGLFASGPPSFKNLRSRETSSTPRS